MHKFHCKDCGNEFEVELDIDYDWSGVTMVYTANCMFCGGSLSAGFIPRKSFNVGDKMYLHPIHSDSMAIHPEQATEHRRLFPGIKLDNEYRPVFESVKQHDKYLNDCGCVKLPQKIRAKGKRVKIK